ncbi:hypothetical protein RMS29_027220 (plasmid) [Agrobacterium rosae]|uniref:Uncharacterized protein n=1 Tax=Agrobacterium rosae TaxID=1972867 RepID=A0ABU4W2S0_9HYPH|nr:MULTISPECIES: hypothetical protein [Agrobacterium]MDX8332080.1 hypothetical protein [Agrobacterium rosae]WCK17157.1 hypothetical protein G6L41_026770 [Agrobacterium tumefaciens]
MKNTRIRRRKDDVAQAAYAFATDHLLDMVAIILASFFAHGRFDM